MSKLAFRDDDAAAEGLSALAAQRDESLAGLSLWGTRLGGVELLASALGNTPALTSLGLWDTGLTAAGVGVLAPLLPRTLRRLDLSSNPLGDAALGYISGVELPELEDLGLSKCQLTALPREICLLPGLRRLWATLNQLRTPPQSLFTDAREESAEAARGFWAAMGRGAVENDQIKTAVVGRWCSGKTSLRQGLCKGRADPAAPEARTICVDVQLWKPAADSVALLIWDHGGQREYDAVHHLFWSAGELIVLAWDVRRRSAAQMEGDVLFWLRALQASVPGATVQIVATHADTLVWLPHLARGRATRAAAGAVAELMRRVREQEARMAAEVPLVVPEALAASGTTFTGMAAVRDRLAALARDVTSGRLPLAWADVRLFLLHLRVTPGSPAEAAASVGETGRARRDWDVSGDVVRRHVPFAEACAALQGVAAALDLEPAAVPETFRQAVRWLEGAGLVLRAGDTLFLHPAWLLDVVRPLVSHEVVRDSQARLSRLATEDLVADVRQDLARLVADGVLSRRALEFLWEPLVPAEVFADTLQLLSGAGALVRVPGSAEGDFFVGARLPPDPPVDALWAALPADASEIEFARAFELQGNEVPPGLVPVLMAACCPRARVLHGWRNGLTYLAPDGQCVNARVEAAGPQLLRVAVRAPLAELPDLARALEFALGRVRAVLSGSFPGLRVVEFALCGLCLLAGREPALDVTARALAAGAAGSCSACKMNVRGLLDPRAVPAPDLARFIARNVPEFDLAREMALLPTGLSSGVEDLVARVEEVEARVDVVEADVEVVDIRVDVVSASVASVEVVEGA